LPEADKVVGYTGERSKLQLVFPIHSLFYGGSMQAIKTVLDSGKLNDIIALPLGFQHKQVEGTIKLLPSETSTMEKVTPRYSESFGMWEDRQDMDDVEAYVRNLREGRKLC
jgi:hypothetical protein